MRRTAVCLHLIVEAAAIAGNLPALGAREGEQRDRPLTIEELRGLARERRHIASSLFLSFDVFQEPAGEGPADWIPYMARSVLVDIDSGRFWTRRETEVQRSGDVETGLVELAFDGSIQTSFLPNESIGIIEEGSSVNGLVESALWGVMLLGEPQPGGLGIDDGSLENLLENGIVRADPESVGDSRCQVVDAEFGGVRYATVWLDVQHDLVPMRRIGYAPDGSILTDVTVDSLAFPENVQLWIPASWRTEFRARGTTFRSRSVVHVESIEFDPPIVADDFVIEFPPGTVVTDQIRGVVYRVAEPEEGSTMLFERRDDEWMPVADVEPTGAGAQDGAIPAPVMVPELSVLAEPEAFRHDSERSTRSERRVNSEPLERRPSVPVVAGTLASETTGAVSEGSATPNRGDAPALVARQTPTALSGPCWAAGAMTATAVFVAAWALRRFRT